MFEYLIGTFATTKRVIWLQIILIWLAYLGHKMYRAVSKPNCAAYVSNLECLIAWFSVLCAANHATLVGSHRRRNYLMNQCGTRSVAFDQRIQLDLHSIYSRGDLCPHNIQISHRPIYKATERFPSLRNDSTVGCIFDLLHRNSIVYQIAICCSSGSRLFL